MARQRIPFGNTTRIGALLNRFEAGDPSARDELLAESEQRLRHLASKMLKQFPHLVQQGRVETGVVLNDAMMRLHNCLDQLELDSPEKFIAVAANNIQFSLLDLARKYKAEIKAFRNAAPHDGGPPDVRRNAGAIAGSPLDGMEQIADPASLDRDELSEEDWADFHLAVATLPADELSVFTLRYYSDRSREETAYALGVTEKTVSRRFVRAQLHLAEVLRKA